MNKPSRYMLTDLIYSDRKTAVLRRCRIDRSFLFPLMTYILTSFLLVIPDLEVHLVSARHRDFLNCIAFRGNFFLFPDFGDDIGPF